MNKTLKQILSRLLLLVLIVSFVVSSFTAVLAEDGDNAEPVVEETQEKIDESDDYADFETESGEAEADSDGDDADEDAIDAGQTEEVFSNTDATVEIPFGFPGMGEGYTLSERQLAEKGTLSAYGLPGVLADAEEGVDYVQGELSFNADSMEYVLQVAEAYNADLISYSLGVALIRLRTNTVYEAMTVAADISIPMPAVNPNYCTDIDPVAAPKMMMMAKSASAGAASVPVVETWQSWYDSFENKDDVDDYLCNPNASDTQYQWLHEDINSFSAWGVTTGNSNIKIAVIDTGVDPTHPDFEGTADDTLPDGSDPNYGTFYVSRNNNVVCYCVSNLSGSRRIYAHNHGTHCAGIIAASMGNGKGGSGVAPGCTIVSINAYSFLSNGRGNLSYADQAKAINLARELGCDIISMSLGGYYYSSMVDTAVQNAVSSGCTIIAAMGNDGSNIKMYPAAYNNVIAVGATDSSGKLASFSNYGAWCDVCAPGKDIVSCVPDSSGSGTEGVYKADSGTSMATPVVAGVAALYMSKYGHVSPAVMEGVLKSCANKCFSTGSGAGIVDASKLFSGDKTPPAIICYDENNLKLEDTASGVSVAGHVSFSFGTESEDQRRVIVYTTDGTTPSILNGAVSNGILIDHDTAEIEGEELLLNTLGKIGTTVTIKAISVSGMGIASSVNTTRLKLIPSNAVEDISITAPDIIAPGSRITLKAYVLPDTAVQDLVWSVSGAIDATISSAGVLTVPAYANGTVTVRATSAVNSQLFKDCTINIASISKISSISSLPTAITLSCKPGFDYFEEAELNPKFILADGSSYSLFKSYAPDEIDTLKASFSSSNPKVATVNSDGVIKAVGKGSATIYCMALDGSGKRVSVKVSVRQLVETVSISGISSIAPGKKAAYKASALPLNANSRKLEWFLVDAPAGVSIDSNGVVKVGSGVRSGVSFKVGLRAKDGSGAEALFDVRTQPRISYLNTYIEDTRSVVDYTMSSSGTIKKLSLFSAAVQGNDFTQAQIGTECGLFYDVDFSWSSTKPTVATVNSNGMITAHGSGTAKIVCKANDGSGIKTSFIVNVITPASSLRISPTIKTDSGKYTLGFGKTMSFVCSPGTAYGNPSKPTGQTWSFEIIDDSGKERPDLHRYIKINQSNGRVTVSRSLINVWYYDTSIASSTDLQLRVYCSYSYGSGSNRIVFTAQSKDITLTPAATKVRVYSGYDSKTGIYSGVIKNFTMPKGVSDFYFLYSNGNKADWNFTVRSDNPSVCGCAQSTYYGAPVISLYSGSKPGKAKIIVVAADGSGVSYSFYVTVK